MKVHYVYTQFNRFTACGLLDAGLQEYITQDPGEVTCKSCLRCFNSYVQRQAEVRESLEHLSNEELLVSTIEMLVVLWHSWHTASEVNDRLAVLLHRLVVVGFITEPEKVDVELWYC